VNSKHNFKLAAFLGIAILLLLPGASFGAVSISVGIAPPPLPVYTQPEAPGPDYIWEPGYWAYGPAGYYWVPGTWVLAPEPGLLWTPGYWAFVNGSYVWNPGYWGPQVGYYGGVDYGFGYFGHGFVGGRWVGRHFDYNTAVMHVNPAVVHNTYVDRSVIRNRTASHASFNGPGGVTARPTAAETAAEHQRHVAPTTVQTAHERNAGANRNNLQSVNHGRPATMATSRPVAQPANPAAVNRSQTARPQSTVNRAPSQREQVRPPAVANRPATENRPQASHAVPAAPRAESRPAPVYRQQQPARPPAVAARPASPPANFATRPSRPEPAARPAPQRSAPAPARQAPAQHPEERR
jgi:hypothetical protein